MLIECWLCTQRLGAFSNTYEFISRSRWPRSGNTRIFGFDRRSAGKIRALPRVTRLNEAAFSHLWGLVFFYQAGGSYSAVPRPAA